jgi:hypothetical protein
MNDQCHIVKQDEAFPKKELTYTPLGPFIVPILEEDEKLKKEWKKSIQ